MGLVEVDLVTRECLPSRVRARAEGSYVAREQRYRNRFESRCDQQSQLAWAALPSSCSKGADLHP